VHALFIRRRLQAIFDFRRNYVAAIWPLNLRATSM
jgi:hypothetical protein